MQIGVVVGTVVATIKDEKLRNFKLQVVRSVDEQNQTSGSYVVAVDAVGAGHGDHVLYAQGSSARQTGLTEGRPTDATIMAIIDSWDVDGEVVYRARGSEPA